jgi:predicted FMN-binding regulatory protein PaiB
MFQMRAKAYFLNFHIATKNPIMSCMAKVQKTTAQFRDRLKT